MASEESGQRMPVTRHTWLVVFVVIVAVHLAALYWPSVTISGPVSWTDKVVHAILFGLPVLVGARVFRDWRWPILIFAVHAPVSELIQRFVLPQRSGDPFDALADLTGVAIGAAVAWWSGSRVGWSGAGSAP